MRWIFLAAFLSSFCEAGDPPFSDLQRKPSLSPYMRYADGACGPFDLGANRDATNAGSAERAVAPDRRLKDENVNHEYLTPQHGIRPTGHPTYFMYVPYYRL